MFELACSTSPDREHHWEMWRGTNIEQHLDLGLVMQDARQHEVVDTPSCTGSTVGARSTAGRHTHTRTHTQRPRRWSTETTRARWQQPEVPTQHEGHGSA
eukprot:7718509-Pyramimonas_sp.AAC.1